MHDINNLDKLGVPGMVVATTEFKVAAASQAKSLGFDPALVWVPHPVQNRTSDEISQIVDDAYESILDTLKGNGKN